MMTKIACGVFVSCCTFLPQNNLDGVPRIATKDPEDRADLELDTLIPLESNKPYDMKDVIAPCCGRRQLL